MAGTASVPGSAIGRFFARFVDMLLPGGTVRYCLFSTGSSCAIPTFSPILPGIEGHRRPHQFGYNKKVHALHFVFYLPVSVLLAWVCTLL